MPKIKNMGDVNDILTKLENELDNVDVATKNNLKIKRKIPILINVFKHTKIKNEAIKLKAICLFKFLNKDDYDLKKLLVTINNIEIPINIKFKKGIPFIKKYYLNYYELEIPLKIIHKFDIQNKIITKYDDYKGRIIYNVFDFKKGKCRNSKVYIKDNTSIYFRQTVKNTMYLTVRETNFYDTRKGKIKLGLAHILSKFYFKKNILLYEKECSKYEESASILYEKLIDKGYNNCYYILNKDNPVIKDIDKKYRKHIVYKDSLKHIVYFFKCNKFIGTETIGHALQLRIANKYAMRKIQNPNLDYVFLQHGVMYMISLDCDLRSGFRNTNYKTYRVVVSSELEAEHFINLGRFDKENLYITGLAKFDKSVLNKNNDKIVIMPTWRRWETNQARYDFSQTNYYKMIERIVNAIPAKLKNKIIVLPHPLMIKAIQFSENELKKYIPKNISYNEILKDCKLLITDYSSISYDAFFRGSNVIFYWEEKDECLKQYGKNTKLMINDESAFGDVCYNQDELTDAINKNYYSNQLNKYKERYKNIVQFDDRKNTDRIINRLIEDKII